MLDWCMAHPWMTFFLGLAALGTVDTVAKALGGKWSRPRKEKP